MHKSKVLPRVTPLLVVLTLSAVGTTSLWAENVFVTAYKGTLSTTDVTPNPPCIFTGCSLSGASSASASTATPTPVIPATGRRVVIGNTTSASWSVTPTDIDLTPDAGSPTYHFTSLQHIGVYKVYITDGQYLNGSPTLLVHGGRP